MQLIRKTVNGVHEVHVHFSVSLTRVAIACEYVLGYTLLALAIGTLVYSFINNPDIL